LQREAFLIAEGINRKQVEGRTMLILMRHDDEIIWLTYVPQLGGLVFLINALKNRSNAVYK